MSKNYELVRRLIREANPMPVDSEHRVSLSPRAEDDLAAIVSASVAAGRTSLAGDLSGFGSRAGWRPNPRRVGLGVIAAALSVALIAALGPAIRRVTEHGPAAQRTALTPTPLTYQLTAGSSRSLPGNCGRSPVGWHSFPTTSAAESSRGSRPDRGRCSPESAAARQPPRWYRPSRCSGRPRTGRAGQWVPPREGSPPRAVSARAA